MKRIIILLVATLAIGTLEAQAQSLDDLMKSISAMFSSSESTQQAQPKEVYPNEEELVGRFKYDALAIDYKGDSALASLAVTTLESQLPLIAEKLGLVAGRDYMDVAPDGSMTIVCNGKQIPVYCTAYDTTTGTASIMMRLLDRSINLKASVTKLDGRYRIVFDAQELLSIIAQHDSKFAENTTLQMVKGVIDSYSGVRVGAFLRK